VINTEIAATDRKTVRVQNQGGLTVLEILGPQRGVQGRAWLDRRQAAQVATAIMKSYRDEEVTP
jgi:hypothetical protein